MLILAFDTATPVGSVALVDAERTLVARYFDIGLQHSQRLFVEIDQVLALAEIDLDEVDGIAVSIGPGSFTGLRIGLSAAKGLCLAADRALVPVSTLEVLAARLPYARYPVCAMLDARKGEVYAALYDNTAGSPQLLSQPRAVAPDALLEELAAEPTIYTGDGAYAYQARIAALGLCALLAPAHCARPEAGTLGRLALTRLQTDPAHGLRGSQMAALEPQYLRKPDAKVGPRPFPRR